MLDRERFEDLDQDLLQEVLRYKPKTGEFFWLRRPGKGTRSDLVGRRAGYPVRKGYWDIEIGGRAYKVHRLAWLYVYGDWPKDQIDHINRDKADNRIVNLREAANGQNGANSKPKPSRSGLKGAHWQKREKKWSSDIHRNGRKEWLGFFDTAEAAHKAYCKAAKKTFGEFFHAG